MKKMQNKKLMFVVVCVCFFITASCFAASRVMFQNKTQGTTLTLTWTAYGLSSVSDTQNIAPGDSYEVTDPGSCTVTTPYTSPLIRLKFDKNGHISFMLPSAYFPVFVATCGECGWYVKIG